MAKQRAAWGIGAGVAATAAGLALFSRAQGAAAERRVPADGRFVEVDGARLHYVELGAGPPVVMVHGLGGQLRNFSYAVADLVAAEHRVILFDRPRSGYSTVPAGVEPGIVDQAALIAQGIRALGLDRPLLVGHSLGGALSLALALNEPGLVRALALIAPLTQPQREAPAAFRGLTLGGASRAGRLAAAHLIGTPLATLTGPATLKQIFAPEPAPADFDVRGGGALALRPGNLAAAMFEMTHASDEMAALAPRYAELTLPVSILFGREDNLLDWRHDGEQTAAALLRGELELVDGGHMLPVTQPELTARFVEAAAAR
jgi:pimeloyl-ACP methyl ester carboxylesterase